MKRHLLLALSPFLFLYACSSHSDGETEAVTANESDSAEISTHIFEIKDQCAVILSHSVAELDSMQAAVSDDIWAEIASDIGYYNATATEDLDARGIKVIDIDDEQIAFVQRNGQRTVISRRTYDYDMVFFNPEKRPKGTYTAQYEEDLSYFGIAPDVVFLEGYWVSDQHPDQHDHTFEYFYKTSYINDEPFLQVFDSGKIIEEEVINPQKDGSFKHPNEDISYTFSDNAITIMENGSVRGLVKVGEDRIQE